MIGIFNHIYDHYCGNNNDISMKMSQHIHNNLVFNDDDLEHLPISVFSYIRPTMGTQFILHLLLSLEHFSTEIDPLLHERIRELLRYAKLIGQSNDTQSLRQYTNDLLSLFVTE